MTPITRERLVRLSVKAVLEGPPQERLPEVLRRFAELPAHEERALLKALRPPLKRALRQKTALVRFGAKLPEALDAQLEAYARERGMFSFEREGAPKELAGFSLTLGDTRVNLTLRGRLENFLLHP